MLAVLVITLIAIGSAIVLGTWINKRRLSRCTKYKYVYRPSVRTFTEEQTEPVSVFKMYQDMFWQQSPWISTEANPMENHNGYINPFVWGELPKTDLGTVRESHDFLNRDYS